MLRNSTQAFFLLVVLLAAQPGRAQSSVQAMTEHPMPGEFKLSEGAFEDAYAFNDTARALIRMRYSKRNTGLNIARLVLIPAPILGLIGRHKEPTVSVVGNTVTISPNSYYYDPWVAPAVYSLLGVSLGGLILAGNHGRDKLYEEVRQYRATRRLPASVRPATLVPYLMQAQQEGSPGR